MVKAMRNDLFSRCMAEGKLELIPAKRTIKVQFFGVKDSAVTVSVGGKEVKKVMAAFHKGYDNVLTITLD